MQANDSLVSTQLAKIEQSFIDGSAHSLITENVTSYECKTNRKKAKNNNFDFAVKTYVLCIFDRVFSSVRVIYLNIRVCIGTNTNYKCSNKLHFCRIRCSSDRRMLEKLEINK